jgi:hypothetical protein
MADLFFAVMEDRKKPKFEKVRPGLSRSCFSDQDDRKHP